MKFQTVKGMRDFLPDEMIKRNYVLDVIRATFEKWGFESLETPAVESFDLLAAKSGSGEEIKKEIYHFKDKSNRDLGLRFDLTVGTSRLVSSMTLPRPFKRYTFGKVWRYDNPQSGRYREFMQTDIDIFGSKKPEADAEIIGVTCDVFKSLGFNKFVIRLSNRKIIEGFVKSIGVNKVNEVFRSIDKLDKIGESGVKQELKKYRISEPDINKIVDFISTKGKPKKVLGVSKKIKNKLAKEGSEELEKIMESIKILGYEKNAVIDLSLVRGLDYYTGPVFEVSVSGGKWSLAGGGRYDNMIKKLGGQDMPATGLSLGFERIIEVMKQEKMFRLPETNVNVFVAPVNDEVRKDAMKICNDLRNKGISVDTDLMDRKLGKQMEYASTKLIPFVVIVGKKELKKGKVKIRNMKTGKEKEVLIKSLDKNIS